MYRRLQSFVYIPALNLLAILETRLSAELAELKKIKVSFERSSLLIQAKPLGVRNLK